jgi:hypothetical protein
MKSEKLHSAHKGSGKMARRTFQVPSLAKQVSCFKGGRLWQALAQLLFNRNANGVREAKPTQAVGLAVKQAELRRAPSMRAVERARFVTHPCRIAAARITMGR